MKKILIAMENDDLVLKMKKTGKYLVYDQAISFNEGVIEYLSKNPVDIIITKDNLNGNMTKEIYLKQLRLIAPNAKIIVFTNALDETYKGFLFANEIFNIIESDSINFTDILEMIENTKGEVIYKNKGREEEIKRPVKVITKKLIAVFGTSGAGKSYFSSLIGNCISKRIKLNTLIIDMDTQNSALDIYNNINSYDNSLMQVMEDIDNDAFDSNSLYDSITKAKKNTKLYYLVNNTGLYEAQHKLSTMYYSRLYAESTSKFDVTVVDLPAAPFLDVVPYTLTKANDIFFVLNPNFLSIRQAVKYLELMVNVWGIPKESIHIVVNKKRKASLDKSQVETLLRGFKVCVEIEDSESVEEIVNGIKEVESGSVTDNRFILSLFGTDTTDSKEKDSKKRNVYGKINKMFGVRP